MINITTQLPKTLMLKLLGKLAFVLAYFNNTYFVYLSVLESRKSEAIRLLGARRLDSVREI